MTKGGEWRADGVGGRAGRTPGSRGPFAGGCTISAEVEPPPAPPLDLRRSRAGYERACRVIPGGSQTLSKRPAAFAHGRFPMLLQRGQGAHVWDVDGNEYIDYVLAMGPVTLGYAHPRVDAAIAAQLRDGITFSLPHPLEAEVAERLTGLVPCARLVRFLKGGAEATSAAIRLARAFTGRERVLYCGYHGWHDWYHAGRAEPLGAPRALSALVRGFPYGDLGALAALLSEQGAETAAVIMEPVHATLPPAGYLEGVRELTARHGVLLVFDEIVTGFRVHAGGAQAYFGVTPDLACFAKGLANGMPLAAVAGRADVMQLAERALISVTYGGECLSLAAAAATLDELTAGDALARIWEAGRRLIAALQLAAGEAGVAAHWSGLPCMPTFHLDLPVELREAAWTLILAETASRGVLFRRGGFTFVSAAHTPQDVDRTAEAFTAALWLLRRSLERGTLAHDAAGVTVRAGPR